MAVGYRRRVPPRGFAGTGHPDLYEIGEVFGSHVRSEAHAGAGKPAAAQAMTKCEVSPALHGTGRGVVSGFAFGKFTLDGAD